MKVLVFGAGLQGAACAYDLLSMTDAEVTLADYQLGALPRYLGDFERTGRLTRVEVDVREEVPTRRVMEGCDAVLNALPYYYNFDVSRIAVDAGAHCADLGGNTEIVHQQETLDDAARRRGVSVVPDCGLAPGMVNILAADGIARFDEVDSVTLFVGGLPQHPEPPLNYQIVYSLEGALDYYTTLSWVLRDGEPIEVEALSELEDVAFQQPVGTLEAFHTAGGLSTMPWVYRGRVKTMEYKTLRYPGHAVIMKAIRDLGLLDLEPITVEGVRVAPRDVFISVVERVLRKPEGRDLVALKVVATGRKAGRSGRVSYQLLDRYDEAHGISAMSRATAYSLSITGQMQVEGRISTPGVHTAYEVTPAAEYVAELGKRGLDIEIRETWDS